MLDLRRNTDSDNVEDGCDYEVDVNMYFTMALMGIAFVVIYLIVAVNIKIVGQRLLFSNMPPQSSDFNNALFLFLSCMALHQFAVHLFATVYNQLQLKCGAADDVVLQRQLWQCLGCQLGGIVSHSIQVFVFVFYSCYLCIILNKLTGEWLCV